MNNKTMKTAKHKLINSDNLIALQQMQEQGQVECILIDPPYNTGNKMKYLDSFTHQEWKTFMQSRLILAHQLLKENGVIFIHINDKEYANLYLLMNEIFGEDNFIENFIWVKNSIKNNSKTSSNNHEYILCFAKNKKVIEKLNYFRKDKEGLTEVRQIKDKVLSLTLSTEEKREILQNELKQLYKNSQFKGIKQYKFVDDNLEIFRISDVSAPNKNGHFFKIPHPKTKKICKNPAGGYRYNEETIKQLLKDDLLYFGKNEKTVPQYKRFLKDVEKEVVQSVIVNFDDGLKDLHKHIICDFNNPKPVSLLKNLLSFINLKEFTVLDFFAGSGSTFESCLQLNQEGKKISSISITNNENNIFFDITLKRFQSLEKEMEEKVIYEF